MKTGFIKELILNYRFLGLSFAFVFGTVLFGGLHFIMLKWVPNLLNKCDFDIEKRFLLTVIPPLPLLALLWFFRNTDTQAHLQKAEENLEQTHLLNAQKLALEDNEVAKELGVSQLEILFNSENPKVQKIVSLTLQKLLESQPKK